MSAGLLRNLVTIQSSTVTASSNGDMSQRTWAELAQVYARIIYEKASESSGDRDATQGKATIKIRYRSDVTNKMRVTFDSRVFDIENNYDPTGRKQYLMLNCVIPNGS